MPPELGEENGHFQTVRRVRNSPYDGYATLLFGPGTGAIDFDTPSDYHGPAFIVTGGRHWLSSADDGPHAQTLPDGRRGGSMRNLHAVTPETRTTTHYFGGFSRNYRKGDHAFATFYT
jgi:vanillate O-demethylase monooxygenase subunit